MILIWNNERKECVIANHNQMVKTDERPELDFNFDSLHVEDEISKKEMNAETYSLTQRELGLCLKYIRGFSFPEITVSVVAEDGFYKGMIPISKMEIGDIIVDSTPPDFDYIYENGQWSKMLLIIDDKGRVYDAKKGRKPLDVAIVFTDDNKPYRMPKEFEIWDFKSEKWKDTRDLNIERFNAETMIRQAYETQTPLCNTQLYQSEIASYPLQLEEAKNYLKDFKSETIFLDKLIKERNEKVSKDVLANKILKKDKEFRKKLATMIGRQRNILKELEKVKNLKELDVFVDNFQKLAFAGEI